MKFERYILGELNISHSNNICRMCLYPIHRRKDGIEILEQWKELVVDLPKASNQEDDCICTDHDRALAMRILNTLPPKEFDIYCARLRAWQPRLRT